MSGSSCIVSFVRGRLCRQNAHRFQAHNLGTPVLFFSETSGLWNHEDGDVGIAAPLDEVHYTYTVLNNGTVTLTNFVVTDTVIVGTVCSESSLSPGKSFTCGDNIYLVSTCGQDDFLQSRHDRPRNL